MKNTELSSSQQKTLHTICQKSHKNGAVPHRKLKKTKRMLPWTNV